MFSLNSSDRFYLYSGFADMRQSFDGLCGIVTNALNGNPQSGCVYVFLNKTKNKIKLLHWESGGFTLYYKRLEVGTFEMPSIKEGQKSVSITWPELVMMISGYSLKHIKRSKKRYEI